MHKHPSKSLNLLSLKFLSTAFAGIALSLSSAHADFEWKGTTSSDPSVSSNYNGTPPVYGSSNSGNFFIANGVAGSALGYSATQGTTSFTGNIRVGSTAGNAASNSSGLNVSGGSLTINSSGTSTIGYLGSGTIAVSGGTFAVNGGDQFWFGNSLAATANVSGGTFIVGDQFLFGRDTGAISTLNLSGNGVFNVTGASGLIYRANNTATTSIVATINLAGNSIYEQTGSNALTNVSPTATNFNVNFSLGSAGTFALLGSDTTSLNSLITNGYFQVGGVDDTNLSDYTVTGAPNGSSLGTIQLASVPEPSTWAMMLGGLGILVGFQRSRARKA